jgi:hypothetical protein
MTQDNTDELLAQLRSTPGVTVTELDPSLSPGDAWAAHRAAERAAMTPEELQREAVEFEEVHAAFEAEMERLHAEALQMIADGHDLLCHVYSGLEIDRELWSDQARRSAYERHMEGLLKRKPGPKPKGRPPRDKELEDIAKEYVATADGQKFQFARAAAERRGVELLNLLRQIARVKKRLSTDPWS